MSICQATRLLFLFLSTSPDGLPQPRYASPDLYVKFIVSPVTSAMPGQLKEKMVLCVYKCVCVCVCVCVCHGGWGGPWGDFSAPVTMTTLISGVLEGMATHTLGDSDV